MPNVRFDMIDIDNHKNEYTYDIEEQHIYGSSRLGVQKPAMQLSNIAGRMVAQKTAINKVGDKRYELSNHLGNVLEVITDKKIRDKENITTFIADVVAYNDYYPFGMLVPNRNYQSPEYRYGFQGQEKDDEIKGEGNSYDFGARMLDVRIGRWFRSDPSEYTYPMYSTYSYVNNNPLVYIDPDGKKFINPYKVKFNKAKQNLQNVNSQYQKLLEANNGNLKASEVKKFRKNQLRNAQKGFDKVDKNYRRVERYLYTLKTVLPVEYNYFETLVDSKENEVKINIFIDSKSEGAELGDGSMRAQTLLKGAFSNPIYDSKKKLIDYKVTGVRRNNIDIILYEKTLSALGNELGDIKYYFKNVTNKKTYDYFVESANGANKAYSDSKGSGVFSFEYEDFVRKAYKEFRKNSSLDNDEFNRVEETISIPSPEPIKEK